MRFAMASCIDCPFLAVIISPKQMGLQFGKLMERSQYSTVIVVSARS